MSAPSPVLPRLRALGQWAYRSLLLTLLALSLLRLAFGDGGWFNEFALALILALPLAVGAVRRGRAARRGCAA